MDVRAVEPFLRGGAHGYVACVETESGCVRDAEGRPVILCRGLLHGSVEEMKAQVDYTIGRCAIHGRVFCTIIETRHPSFRFPDSSLRAVLHHLRKYTDACGPIYLVGLPGLVARGVRLFAFPFLDADTKARLHFVAHSPVNVEDFDPLQYVAWRRAVEEVEATVSPRPFSHAFIVAANEALRKQASEDVVNEAVLYSGPCEKRGGGGLFGTRRWKSKTLVVTRERLFYRDSGSVGSVPLSGATWRVETALLYIVTPARTFEFRLPHNDLATVAAALRKTTGISAHETSVDGERI